MSKLIFNQGLDHNHKSDLSSDPYPLRTYFSLHRIHQRERIILRILERQEESANLFFLYFFFNFFFFNIDLEEINLKALAMDDGRSRLVVLLLGDPHLLEGGERGQDGTSDPDRVLALWGSNDLDLHGGRGEGSELLLHAVSNAGEH